MDSIRKAASADHFYRSLAGLTPKSKAIDRGNVSACLAIWIAEHWISPSVWMVAPAGTAPALHAYRARALLLDDGAMKWFKYGASCRGRSCCLLHVKQALSR